MVRLLFGCVAATILLSLAGCSPEVRPVVGLVVSARAIAAGQMASVADSPGGDTLVSVQALGVSAPSQAAAALEAADRLVSAGAIAVVGHSNSAASLAASPVYNEARVVQIAPTTTATVYASAGPYSFRMVPSDREQASALVAAARQLGGGREVAVIYENDEYGYGLYRDLLEASRAADLGIALSGGYVLREGARGAQLLVDRVLAKQPGALLWLGRGIPLDTVLPRLRARAPDLPVIASDALDDDRTRANAGGIYTGLYFIQLLDADSMAAAVAKRPASERPLLHSPEAVLTYDAVRLVVAAVQAGARSGDDVREYLMSLGRSRPAFRGVSGAIQFDADRSVRRAWRVGQLRPDGVHLLEATR